MQLKLSKWCLMLLLTPFVAAFAATPQAYKHLEKLVAPYVPTSRQTAEAVLCVANVGAGDYVIEGAMRGEARVPRTRHKWRAARAVP